MLHKLLLSIATFFFIHAATAQNKWTNYNNKDDVHCVAIEGNKVWIATNGGVVCRDTSGSIIAEYSKEDGLSDVEIYCIAIDMQGNKWFGTNNGISKFDNTNWTTYDISNFELENNNVVLSIAIDAQGNV